MRRSCSLQTDNRWRWKDRAGGGEGRCLLGAKNAPFAFLGPLCLNMPDTLHVTRAGRGRLSMKKVDERIIFVIVSPDVKELQVVSKYPAVLPWIRRDETSPKARR